MPQSSYLDAVSVAARLAKVSAIRPPPRHFEPFLLHPAVDPESTTACLWAPENDLDWLVPWTAHWQGPISLLIVTRKPLGPRRSPLPRSVARIMQLPAFNASLLSLHMLYLDPSTSDAPNAFLNLARLFSPTLSVLLVPALAPIPPPATLHTHIKTPVLVTNASHGRPPYPFPSLSPVLIARNHPLWCTERFLSPSRAADWDECLWQLHLETFGHIAALAVPRWQWAEARSSAQALSPVMVAIRRRLGARYRSETCVLALKRLEAFAIGERGRTRRVDAEKVRWLERTCKEWTSGVFW
ncbi:hypothetical protein BV25DRAFT_1811494 [Artomyces pyxidatus]|uniref:Uncharacterized protein n=1 Tax=Artomyces pyxidatus TaxID=48021 RepID=A0ACB8SPX3_9AGAM|nr:hypothetical protein BV25DRAFT_1811494 [Artomyces pyxidatus]